MNAKRLPMEIARINMAEMILRVRYMRERYVIERHGKPVALVIPLDDRAPEPDMLPDHCQENLKEIAATEVAA